jgi:hypothetical protein
MATRQQIEDELARGGYVRRVVDKLMADPSLHSDTIAANLIADGVKPYLAHQLVVILPEAFCQLLIEGSGAKPTQHCYFLKANGKRSDLHWLVQVPSWGPSLTLARKLRVEGMAFDDFLRIAGRGARFDYFEKVATKSGAEGFKGATEAPLTFYGITMKDPSRRWWQLGY